MAKLPTSVVDLFARYGPHRHNVPAGGWPPVETPDRVVKTHCCFCGQQCGIQLEVKDNRVIGFEPWEDFPFNRGKLCPKGVKRYMQGSHQDRLTSPLARVEGRGFEPLGWDEALDRVASAIQRIQTEHGRDAYAVLSGASLTNEKAYLMGKLARVALRTANIDYNGRLCMVSAAAASKKVLGIDRSANPWSDIPKADVILIAGSNVAECAPITTDYLWKARERGAKIIVLDPRMTPIARTADLYIPVRPGGDIGVFHGMLQVMIERGMIDRPFIDAHTTGFEALARTVASYTLERAAKIAGVPASMIVRAAELWGPAKTSFLLHARGIEHHSKGVENCCAALNLVVATGRIGREGCGYAMITGQGNGQGGREQGQKCDQLPGGRDIENPEHRRHMAEIWGVPEPSIPHKGVSAVEIVEKIHAGEIKGLLLICFNPLVSLPDQGFVREALEKLEHFTVIDFFLSETAQHADIVLAGSLMEEDEGTTTNVEGRVILHRKVVDPPDGARVDWKIVCDLAARLGAGEKFAYREPREIFDELRLASRGSVPDYYGITYERIIAEHGVFWPCPSLEHPGTPRLYEGPRFAHPDGKAHFQAVEWRPAADEPGGDYPIYLTTGRVVAHYLSGTQTRRIGALDDQTPGPYCEIHPKLAGELGVVEGDFVEVQSRRGSVVVRASVVRTIRPDTVFIPYHWPHDRAANRLTVRALDPVSKIPEYKICAVRVAKAARPDDDIARLPPEAGGCRLSELAFFVDYSRCIGCQACVQACEECDTHRGVSMIHLETIRRRDSVQTAPQVCMHCEDPICARVCPADAIKKTDDGVVHSSLKPRCIGCSNCVLSCPFGVPKYMAAADQMMKCDLCYDRTSAGKRPMCATVCPSQALSFTTMEDIRTTRAGVPVNEWRFGGEAVRTKVFVLVPPRVAAVEVDGLVRLGKAPPEREPDDVAALLELP